MSERKLKRKREENEEIKKVYLEKHSSYEFKGQLLYINKCAICKEMEYVLVFQSTDLKGVDGWLMLCRYCSQLFDHYGKSKQVINTIYRDLNEIRYLKYTLRNAKIWWFYKRDETGEFYSNVCFCKNSKTCYLHRF